MDNEVKEAIAAFKGYINVEAGRTRHILRVEKALMQLGDVEARINEGESKLQSWQGQYDTKINELKELNQRLAQTRTDVKADIEELNKRLEKEVATKQELRDKLVNQLDEEMSLKEIAYSNTSKEMDAVIAQKTDKIAALEAKHQEFQKLAVG